MTIRFWKWLIVVLAAAAIVIALRNSMETAEDDPTLGRTTAPAVSSEPTNEAGSTLAPSGLT
jgi:hypothetical protein